MLVIHQDDHVVIKTVGAQFVSRTAVLRCWIPGAKYFDTSSNIFSMCYSSYAPSKFSYWSVSRLFTSAISIIVSAQAKSASNDEIKCSSDQIFDKNTITEMCTSYTHGIVILKVLYLYDIIRHMHWVGVKLIDMISFRVMVIWLHWSISRGFWRRGKHLAYCKSWTGLWTGLDWTLDCPGLWTGLDFGLAFGL